MKTANMILWAMMAATAVVCQASNSQSTPAVAHDTQAAIRQRVEQMKTVEYQNQDQILTKGLQDELARVHSIFNINEDDIYVGFEWAPGVMDVCGEKEPEAKIVKVNVVDKTHADVEMLYVDQPCYEIPYTLHLLWEDDAWKIDEVDYFGQEESWTTLRDQCGSFYDLMVEEYRTVPAGDILDNMLAMEPSEENYTDPATIYYNNPKELRHLVDQIKKGHELFKKNPGYQPAMAKKINDMIARIERHIHN